MSNGFATAPDRILCESRLSFGRASAASDPATVMKIAAGDLHVAAADVTGFEHVPTTAAERSRA